MMFDWLGNKYNDKKITSQSLKVEKAVDLIFKKNIKTKDIGGELSTFDFNEKFLQILDLGGYD